MVKPMPKLTLLLLLSSLVACEQPAFKAPVKKAGKSLSVATLNTGRRVYMQYCRACHGDAGKGDGPASSGLRPPPRDFTQGQFKFAGVLDIKLPRDEDLVRIITSNLHGTAMLGWQLPAPELDAVIQYLKTLSPAWDEDDCVGEPVVAPPDPWVGKEAEAVARGRILYHGYAQCLNCHPAYVSRADISAASMALGNGAKTDFREDMYLPEVKPSDYKTPGGQPYQVLPPDFLLNQVRSIQPGTELADLYRILVAGVTGAAMPAWDPASMPNGPPDIWAIAYYVRSLIRMNGSPEAVVLKTTLLAAPPPAAPAAPPPAAAPVPTAAPAH